MDAWNRALFVAAFIAAAAACSSSSSDGNGFAGGDADAGADGGAPIIGNGADVDSLTVTPAQATLEVLNQAKPTQAFTVVAKLRDGTTQPLTSGVAWSVDKPQPGAIDGGGVYTANGTVGAVVKIAANYKGKSASAELTVKLHLTANPGNVDGATQATLKGATMPDAHVAWAYPYDGTVFPRGLGAATLMWNGSTAGDAYYVHLTSPTFELESFARIDPAAAFAFDAATWQKFVDSTAGAAKLAVARFAGGAATTIAKHTWTIAPASMRGTIYYWSNYKGRVLRIKPGATAPDDFSSGVLQPMGASTCTMTCHTVSADGSTLVSGGDILGGAYDLRTNAPRYDLGGAYGSAQKRGWNFSAVSPDGKYVHKHGAADGLFKTADGSHETTVGLEGTPRWFPAFAPDGSSIAYVDLSGSGPTNGSLKIVDFDQPTLTATNDRALVAPGTYAPLSYISYPSVSPDGRWVVFQRGSTSDTRGAYHCKAYDANMNCTSAYLDYTNRGNLYLASAKTPGVEQRLSALDGDTYPFAAGDRDRAWNFEPTFAPVAAGGYFWVVFTSRRTYGNVDARDAACVSGPPDVDANGGKNVDLSCTKHLWVAAIDQSPTPGQDPSHPPFYLPGQETTAFGMRGYWALDPCKGDGQGCASGTECCGGFCDGSGDGGAPVCKSTATCAANGDRCNATTDCCNASSGVTCINHVCSEPPPK